MTFDKTKWIWMNGRLLSWHDATVHVSAHALHYGTGVFEGIRCYSTESGPCVFRLDAHLERLFASGRPYGIEIPYTLEELSTAVCEVIEQNGFESCYVRPICYFGSGVLGLHPLDSPVDVAILGWPWGPYLGEENLERGVKITVSPWRKFQSQMIPTTAKACGQYLNSVLATRDAVGRGYAEALLLDINGLIAEASGENVFIVREGEILTNDDSHSILLGITRDSVIQIAKDLGYNVNLGALELDDLLNAEEAFLTGTAAEVIPISEVDGCVIGTGSRGPMTAAIQHAFFAATSGRDTKYQSWLQPVRTSLSAVNRPD